MNKMPMFLYCHLDNLLIIQIVIENWFNVMLKKMNVFCFKTKIPIIQKITWLKLKLKRLDTPGQTKMTQPYK